ncbi:MAG TPA: YbdD/YjiX family protein [Gemmatimonadales bacterium]|jgi:uncharacterized short protein YbdD (DUF466 family)
MWGRRSRGHALGRSVAWVGGLLRRIAGMPDYGAYVEHVRRCHPGRALPTEREYFEQYVAERYGDGPTRCC